MDMFYIAFYYSNHTHKVKEKILDVYLKSFKENLLLCSISMILYPF